MPWMYIVLCFKILPHFPIMKVVFLTFLSCWNHDIVVEFHKVAQNEPRLQYIAPPCLSVRICGGQKY